MVAAGSAIASGMVSATIFDFWGKRENGKLTMWFVGLAAVAAASAALSFTVGSNSTVP